MDADPPLELTDHSILGSEPQDIPPPNQILLSQISFTLRSIPKPAGKLIDIAGASKDLQLVANNIHKLLSSPGVFKYDLESRQSLEQAINSLMCESIRQADLAKSKQMQAQAANSHQKEDEEMIHKLQTQLKASQDSQDSLTQEMAELKKENAKQELEIHDLNDEIAGLHETNTHLTQKYTAFRRENDESTKAMKAQIDSQQQKCQELATSLKFAESAKVRIQSQLDATNNELGSSNGAIIKLKARLQARKEKISQQEDELRKLSIKIDEIEQKPQSPSPEKAEIQSKLPAENENAKTAIRALSSLVESQSAELKNLNDIKANSAKLIGKQMELISALDSELCQSKEKLGAQTPAPSLEEKAELAQLRKLKEELFELASIDKPEQLRPFFEEHFDEGGIEQNRRLIGLVESEMKFINSFIQTGGFQMSMLDSSTNGPLNEDSEFKKQLMIAFAKMNAFCCQNDLAPQQQTSYISEKMNSVTNGKSLIQREAFSVLASQIINSAAISKFCEKVVNESKQISTAISSLSDKVGFKGGQRDFINYIENRINSFSDFLNEASKIASSPPDAQNIISYLSQAKRIITEVDTDLREAIGFDGPVDQIPLTSVQFIDYLKSSSIEEAESQISQLKDDIQAVRTEASDEKEKATLYISDLEAKLEEVTNQAKEANNELSQLRAKAETAGSEAVESTQQAEASEAKYKESLEVANQLTIDNDHLREEISNLQNQLQKKSADLQSKLDSLLEEERRHHDEDLVIVTKRSAEKEEKLMQIVDSKTKRTAVLKSKLKEVIKAYEGAFRKQQEASAALKDQNNELTEKICQLEAAAAAANEDDSISKLIEGFEEQKKAMLEKSKEAEDEKIEAVSARDRYWASVLATKVGEVNSELSEIKKKSEAFSAEVCRLAGSDGSDSALLKLSAIVDRNMILESENRRAMKPTKPTDRTVRALDDWNKWAKDLLNSVGRGFPWGQTSQQLRITLGEMVISSVSNRSLLLKVESLRKQKELLLKGVTAHETEEKSFKGLILLSLFGVRVTNRQLGTPLSLPSFSRSFSHLSFPGIDEQERR